MHEKVKKDDGYYDGPGGERALYPGWIGLSASQRCNCRCSEVFVLDESVEKGTEKYQYYSRWVRRF